MEKDDAVTKTGLLAEAELGLELPNLNDVEHPVLKRALARVEYLKNEPASLHQKHASHDRTGHTSGYW